MKENKKVIATSGAANENTAKENTPAGRTHQNGEKKQPEHADKEGPLYKYFMDSVRDIYFAEKQILDGLVKMKKATTTYELMDAFEDHHLMTQKHISRLDKVFSCLNEQPEGKKCEAIMGILREADSIISDTEEGTMTRDAALIIAAQKVEHYEIASYGGLVALAETLGQYEAARLLDQNLLDEEHTDRLLTDIAESCINFDAKEESADMAGQQNSGSQRQHK